MITKEIIDFLTSQTGIEKRDLLEKDLILQKLLLELETQTSFAEKYIFKGGTCLVKCYLGYYRFSEDLDFTYKHQKTLKGKGTKEIRKLLSYEINSIALLLEKIASVNGLDFKHEKSNQRYIEYGGSNKFTTLKIWYHSLELKRETFVKIQINYLEEILYPVHKKTALQVFHGKVKHKEFEFLLPDPYKWVMKTPTLHCYDLREILAEKVRAILTRRGIKTRDFVDLYMIEKKGLRAIEFIKEILQKTTFMLQNYEKYQLNLESRTKEGLAHPIGEEERILMVPVPHDYGKFVQRLQVFLGEVLDEITRK